MSGRDTVSERTSLASASKATLPAPSLFFSDPGTWRTHHLPILCALLDIGDEFLLLLFELGAFSIQLALCLLQAPLVLSQPLGGRFAPPKERLNDVHGV